MKVIELRKNFGSLIITRKAIIDFFDSLAEFSDGSLILDFEGIEFISRSAVHEYLRRKTICGIKVKEINLTQNVKSMFLLVARQMQNAVSV